MTGPTGNNQYINKNNPTSHPNDVHYGKGTVCWNQRRDCWVIPGGGNLEFREDALLLAAKMHEYHIGIR